MAKINPKMLHVPKHRRDRMVGAGLSKPLRGQYKSRSARVVKGDSVKIMRGGYKGVEGKVEEVLTTSNSLFIEGVQREKIRGGKVRVPIHSSNVILTNLNLDDGLRARRITGAPKQENPSSEKPVPTKTKKSKSAEKQEGSE